MLRQGYRAEEYELSNELNSQQRSEPSLNHPGAEQTLGSSSQGHSSRSPLAPEAVHGNSDPDVLDGAPNQESDSRVTQKWNRSYMPLCGIATFALVHLGITIFAAILIRKPFILTSSKDAVTKHISTVLYNALITQAGDILQAITIYFWGKLGAGYLVKRFVQGQITYRSYDRCVYWFLPRIHLQMTPSLFISAIIFAFFHVYVAAFTTAFTMHPELIAYQIDSLTVQLSENTNALANVIASPTISLGSDDFESSLRQLGLTFSSNYTPGQAKPFLNVDNMKVQGENGVVLGAEIPASAVVRLPQQNPSKLDPKTVHLLTSNYGSNNLEFGATGVGASTTCSPVSPPLQTATTLNTLAIYNIAPPSCLPITRAYDASQFTVYDAYSCMVGPTIITGIIQTNPLARSAVDMMECSTSLTDIQGTATYIESLNTVGLPPRGLGNFTNTPMSPNATNQVFDYVSTLWVENIGREGSPGLSLLISFTPFRDPTVISKMEEAVSYMYAIGGAKLINIATSQANSGVMPNGASYVTQSTSVEIVTPAFQIGYGKEHRQWPWVFALGLHCLVVIVSTGLMFIYPNMPLDPTQPLSMMLKLALNSPRTQLLTGTSVGSLPEVPITARFLRWLKRCWGGRVKDMEIDLNKVKKDYEGLELQLEASEHDHLQLMFYEGKDSAHRSEGNINKPVVNGEYS